MTRVKPSRSRALTLIALSAFSVLLVAFLACGSKQPDFDPETFDPLTNVPAVMSVKSPEFNEGDSIPVRFTCDGANLPPVISWEKPPNGTRVTVLIVDDPDAPVGIFSHWVVFNIPAADNSVRAVIEGKASSEIIVGLNDFGENAYGGPCPPAGESHDYRFNVFALIAPLELDETATMDDVLVAMRGSVIGHGVLTTVYSRP